MSPPLKGEKRAYAQYVGSLTGSLWTYSRQRFGSGSALLDPRYSGPRNPPVFRPEHADMNVIASSDLDVALQVRQLIPKPNRHRWFRSMKSSQALTLSIFGHLKALGLARVLTQVETEDAE